MKVEQMQLTELLQGNLCFNIPVYQRNYDWRKEQCAQLFMDIENIYKETNNKVNHFLGTIVYIDDPEKFSRKAKQLILIDGQQRITTVILLLKALYDLLLHDMIIKREIEQKYFINEFEDDKIKLKLMEADHKILIDLLENKIISKKEKNIYVNYSYFKELLEETDLSLTEVYEGIHKLSVVCIVLDSNDNPQLIFESINSTGLSLNEGDLIRNFLLMDKTLEEQKRFYNDYWKEIEINVGAENISDYIRDYLIMKMRSNINEKKVYQEFKKYAKKQYDQGIDVEKLLEEISNFSYYYGYFLYGYDSNTNINFILQNLKYLNQTVIYPLLLYIFYKHDENIITNEELISILHLIESYIIRRKICNNSKNFSTLFNSLLTNVLHEKEKQQKNSKNVSYYQIISYLLCNKRGETTFPKDNIFKEKFLQYTNAHKLGEYILCMIERFKNSNNISIKDVILQHIMPKDLTNKWKVDLGKNCDETHKTYMNHIGNLTLISSKKNEINKKDFKDIKKEILNDSLYINNFFDDKIYSWDKKKIEERAIHLFHDVVKIWQYPNIETEFLDLYKIEGTYTLTDEIDVTRKRISDFYIFDKKYSVNSWKEMWIQMCKLLYDRDPVRFFDFTTDEDFCIKNSRIITKIPDTLKEKEAISEHIFIETEISSANSTLNYIKIMLKKYKTGYDFTYTIK